MNESHRFQGYRLSPAMAFLLGASLLFPAACATEPETTPVSEIQQASKPQRLVGQWVRSDGGYLLEIRRVHSSGRLEATYHNPSPINVGTAELKQDEGQLAIFVELRDKGYPGSYYELLYDEKADQLTGNYFQATQQMLYEVVFMRRP